MAYPKPTVKLAWQEGMLVARPLQPSRLAVKGIQGMGTSLEVDALQPRFNCHPHLGELDASRSYKLVTKVHVFR